MARPHPIGSGLRAGGAWTVGSVIPARYLVPGSSMDASLLTLAPAGDLADTMAQLHRAECAVRKTLLEVVAAFDGRRLWAADGATSMAAWLVARLGVSFGTATAWSETAARLQALPALSAAYEEGRLSWDQVRAAAEVADAGNEEGVLAGDLGASAA